MKLEEQVVSLDLAKRLKELGFEQESLFYYIPTSSGLWLSPSLDVDADERCISAYTVAELGEMLPRGFRSGTMEQDSNYYCRLKEHSEYADTEADARARMLIYLKENNLI